MAACVWMVSTVAVPLPYNCQHQGQYHDGKWTTARSNTCKNMHPNEVQMFVILYVLLAPIRIYCRSKSISSPRWHVPFAIFHFWMNISPPPVNQNQVHSYWMIYLKLRILNTKLMKELNSVYRTWGSHDYEVYRLWSSGIQSCVVCYMGTNISEKFTASIFRTATGTQIRFQLWPILFILYRDGGTCWVTDHAT
jgi:hypothetical protein